MNPFVKASKQLSIFTTAGYPKLNSLPEQLEQLAEHGIDFIEVGIPFSDPLADGPVIQHTSSIALRNGMNLEILFDQLKNRTSTTPIVLMGYLNPILQFGLTRFLKKCVETRISSVILPDMSIEIYERLYQDQFKRYGISPSFLITPNTEKRRIQKVAELCKNSFVYLVSSNSTTGGTSFLSYDRFKRFSEIKQLCGSTPLFIGFGIRNKADVLAVQSVSDGAIIGSEFLRSVKERRTDEFINGLR